MGEKRKRSTKNFVNAFGKRRYEISFVVSEQRRYRERKREEILKLRRFKTNAKSYKVIYTLRTLRGKSIGFGRRRSAL